MEIKSVKKYILKTFEKQKIILCIRLCNKIKAHYNF
jgi:hypothetical protein